MRISVVGAYGYTGHLICEELERAGIPFSAFGRNKQKLNSLKEEFNLVSSALVLDMRLADDVKQLIENSDLIVNCAGPFTEEAQLLVDSIANSGKTYLDICGELGFIKDSWVRNHEVAKESGALIIHGCAFESLVADLLIETQLKGIPQVKSIRSFYWFNSKKTSPGTRMTMKLSNYRDNLKIKEGDWAVSDTFKDQFPATWSDDTTPYIAVPYPLPEVAYSKWNHNVNSAGSYLLVFEDNAKFVGVGKTTSESTIDVLDKMRQSKPQGPTKDELEAQRNILSIEISDNKDNITSLVANSINMYKTTAVAIVLSIQEIQKAPGKHCGVISPAWVFEGNEQDVLKELKVEIETDKKLIISDV